MGGTPLLLALALVLVDYGWESDGRDGFRYIVQIPAEQFDALEKGGVITSQIPEEIRGRVSSIEVRVGQGALPRNAVNNAGIATGIADVASAGSRVETAYPAPPDTPVPTVRGQGEDTLRIPSLADIQAAGQDLVDGLTSETKQQISDAAKEAQQNLQRSLREGTQASADYLAAEAQKLLATQGSTSPPSSRLALPPSSSTSTFSTPQPQGTSSGLGTTPTTGSSGWGTAVPSTASNSTLTLNPVGTVPNPSGTPAATSPLLGSGNPNTFSGATTYPQGSSSSYNPNNIATGTASGGYSGTTPTTNPTSATGLPNYSTVSGTYPTTNNSTVPPANTTSGVSLSAQDYWSLERALTKDQQSERDARLLNEVGIGPGEVFVELKSQRELPRTDPRYAAMTDYMNRYYTYQRANSISSNASTLANPVSTGATTNSGNYVGGNNSAFNQNDPLNNMTVSTAVPTTNPSTNPYFGGSGNRFGTTTTSDAWDEAVRKRAEEMLRWEANNPRLAQNANVTGGGLTGPINGGSNLGMPPSMVQGNQTTPISNATQGTGGATSSGDNKASASDQKESSGSGETKRREYQPQALVNFFLLLSLVGNIYLGIAISRLIRRYRNLVAVHRSGTVLSA